MSFRERSHVLVLVCFLSQKPSCELRASRRAGDRVGICVSNLDAKLLERGVVTSPGSVRPVMSAIALVRKVGHATCNVNL